MGMLFTLRCQPVLKCLNMDGKSATLDLSFLCSAFSYFFFQNSFAVLYYLLIVMYSYFLFVNSDI